MSLRAVESFPVFYKNLLCSDRVRVGTFRLGGNYT